MGYCMHSSADDFIIRKENFEKVLKSVKSISKDEYRYSNDDYIEVQESNNIFDVMSCWGWKVSTIEEDINSIYFIWEKYSPHFLTFFNVIAPFVEEGSYIQMTGEEGDIWRYIFDGESCKEIQPTISW